MIRGCRTANLEGCPSGSLHDPALRRFHLPRRRAYFTSSTKSGRVHTRSKATEAICLRFDRLASAWASSDTSQSKIGQPPRCFGTGRPNLRYFTSDNATEAPNSLRIPAVVRANAAAPPVDEVPSAVEGKWVLVRHDVSLSAEPETCPRDWSTRKWSDARHTPATSCPT